MSRSADIRLVLNDKASTCHQIAALLGIPLRSAVVGIGVLEERGHVRKTGRTVPSESRARARNVYELTDRGRVMVRRGAIRRGDRG